MRGARTQPISSLLPPKISFHPLPPPRPSSPVSLSGPQLRPPQTAEIPRKGEEEKVYKLGKALCGLKQAPRTWYNQIDGYFAEKGFQRSKSEPTLYVKQQGESNILIVALYVDDLIFAGSCKKMVQEFKMGMMKKYEMSDFRLLHHLG